jgi:homoserine kinase
MVTISEDPVANEIHSTKKEVKVFAPATVANVGSAFDVLGFALDAPGDCVTASLCDTPGVTVRSITGDNGLLPLASALNTAAVAATALIKELNNRFGDSYRDLGIFLDIEKGLPIGSGLGSSSASAVAGALATNLLLGEPFEDRDSLLPFAIEGERIACGSAHADNVAPSLLGGFVLIRSYSPELDIIKLPAPAPIVIAVAAPALELRTSDARKVLKQSVPLATATAQWGNVAGLIAGIYRNDLELIGRSLDDAIIEPERGQLIPGYKEVKATALKSGALGCSISGSGPSVFAVCSNAESANQVGAAMCSYFVDIVGVEATYFTSGINVNGATIVHG